MSKKFEVQTRFHGYWENCWHEDDETQYFDTHDEAMADARCAQDEFFGRHVPLFQLPPIDLSAMLCIPFLVGHTEGLDEFGIRDAIRRRKQSRTGN